MMLIATDQKPQKSLKRWYYSASRWHSGNLMLGNITLLTGFGHRPWPWPWTYTWIDLDLDWASNTDLEHRWMWSTLPLGLESRVGSRARLQLGLRSGLGSRMRPRLALGFGPGLLTGVTQTRRLISWPVQLHMRASSSHEPITSSQNSTKWPAMFVPPGERHRDCCTADTRSCTTTPSACN